MDELMETPMLFVKCRKDGTPIAYAFGPEWVATALFMDDIGFDTENEAVLYWYHNIYKEEIAKHGICGETESNTATENNSEDG